MNASRKIRNVFAVFSAVSIEAKNHVFAVFEVIASGVFAIDLKNGTSWKFFGKFMNVEESFFPIVECCRHTFLIFFF
jgi:hypothetical protein